MTKILAQINLNNEQANLFYQKLAGVLINQICEDRADSKGIPAFLFFEPPDISLDIV